MLGAPKMSGLFGRASRQPKVEEVPTPPPPPPAWTDASGISWRYYTDAQARAAHGEYLEAAYGDTSVRTFVPSPRYDEDDTVYITHTKDALLARLTPLDRYVLTGSCFG